MTDTDATKLPEHIQIEDDGDGWVYINEKTDGLIESHDWTRDDLMALVRYMDAQAGRTEAVVTGDQPTMAEVIGAELIHLPEFSKWPVPKFRALLDRLAAAALAKQRRDATSGGCGMSNHTCTLYGLDFYSHDQYAKHYCCPSGLSTDPDAALVERVRRAVFYGLNAGQGPTDIARAAIAAMREDAALAQPTAVADHQAEQALAAIERVRPDADVPEPTGADAVEVVAHVIFHSTDESERGSQAIAEMVLDALRAIGWGQK